MSPTIARPASRRCRDRRSWFESGRGLAERPAPMFGLVGVVAADQHDAAGLGQPEHVVPQFGVGRSCLGRHDRKEIAPSHRRQVAIARLGWRARWPIPATNPLVMVGLSASSRSSVSPASVGVGTHQRRPGDQRGQHSKTESTDPEERRIAEQLVRWDKPTNRVEVPLMAEQCGVRVYDALGGGGRARRVDDRQRVRSVDIAFHRGEQRSSTVSASR